jgi:hypothetical protein
MKDYLFALILGRDYSIFHMNPFVVCLCYSYRQYLVLNSN